MGLAILCGAWYIPVFGSVSVPFTWCSPAHRGFESMQVALRDGSALLGFGLGRRINICFRHCKHSFWDHWGFGFCAVRACAACLASLGGRDSAIVSPVVWLFVIVCCNFN